MGYVDSHGIECCMHCKKMNLPQLSLHFDTFFIKHDFYNFASQESVSLFKNL